MIIEIITSVPFLIINSILCLIIYIFIVKDWNFFSKQNVKYVRGPPILGSQYRMIIGKESFFEGFLRMYDDCPTEKVCGMYELGGAPRYVIRDPELIKQISIKDFDHFVNHNFEIHEDADAILGRTMFMMRDQRWKDMRSTLSPAFTGSKMRLMFGLITDVSKQFCKYIHEKNHPFECEMKEMVERFANDAIASCAFGINVDSLKDKNNEFFRTGQALSQFDFWTTIKFFAYSSVPKIMNFLKIPVFSHRHTDYFTRVVTDNIKYREKNGIVRNDMINMLIEAKKGLLKYADEDINDQTEKSMETSNAYQHWSDDDLVAQCMIFFLAGFSTVSVALAFATYELTVNPDIQEKLYQEIKEVKENTEGSEVTYDALQKMKYLDMVVNEVLRRWPPSPANDRIVTKPYTLTGTDGNEIKMNPGDGLWLPVLGIHLDPQYFPNPKKFDPERFRDKDNIIPGTFLPFGSGPRICIASRFALMECKSFLFHLLSNFKLERSSKTPEPMVLKKGVGSIEAENGFWLKMKPR